MDKLYDEAKEYLEKLKNRNGNCDFLIHKFTKISFIININPEIYEDLNYHINLSLICRDKTFHTFQSKHLFSSEEIENIKQYLRDKNIFGIVKYNDNKHFLNLTDKIMKHIVNVKDVGLLCMESNPCCHSMEILCDNKKII